VTVEEEKEIMAINKEKLRELYANATTYEAGHARAELQREELDDWLKTYEPEIEKRVLQEVLDSFSAAPAHDQPGVFNARMIVEKRLKALTDPEDAE
jgi:hypothetical protein